MKIADFPSRLGARIAKVTISAGLSQGNRHRFGRSDTDFVNFRRVCELGRVPAPLPSTAFADIV
jgi:hypothetical protein